MNPRRGLFLNSLALRIIGMLTMTFDHVGIFLLNYAYNLSNPELAIDVGGAFRIVGRIAFPIFIFLLAEGMRHTHNKVNYILRIGGVYLLILVAQLILIYGMGEYALEAASNPFLDLLLCALVLFCLSQKGFWKLFALLPASVLIGSFAIGCYENIFSSTILWWPYAFRPIYSILALGVAIAFYYAPILVVKGFHKFNQELGISDEMYLETPQGRKNANAFSCLIFFLIVLALWGISYLDHRNFDTLNMSVQAWCLLSLVPIFFYNGEKGPGGRALQIFNYLYFPLHIVIIFLIFQAIMR